MDFGINRSNCPSADSFLDGCPDGTVYIVMCFIVRFVEALGASAFSTASFAIMANTFPNNVAAMFVGIERHRSVFVSLSKMEILQLMELRHQFLIIVFYTV